MNDTWADHESEHARGQCECPCLQELEDAQTTIADFQNALLDLWEADMAMERRGYGADRQETAMDAASRLLRRSVE